MVAAARFMPKGGGTYAVSPLKLFLCVLINCCVSRVYEADFLLVSPLTFWHLWVIFRYVKDDRETKSHLRTLVLG